MRRHPTTWQGQVVPLCRQMAYVWAEDGWDDDLLSFAVGGVTGVGVELYLAPYAEHRVVIAPIDFERDWLVFGCCYLNVQRLRLVQREVEPELTAALKPTMRAELRDTHAPLSTWPAFAPLPGGGQCRTFQR